MLVIVKGCEDSMLQKQGIKLPPGSQIVKLKTASPPSIPNGAGIKPNLEVYWES